MKRRWGASLILVAALALSACTSANDGLIDSYEQGGDTGFISGDGSVQEIAIDERGDAVEFTGTEVDGSTVTSADFVGDVLVLNFWYAGCGPCRAEAPTLEATAQKTGAPFLGVNIYDGPEQATAFEETYGISYPSLLAKEDAALKLAFASWTPLQAVPITLVLDAEGRVAARFIGQVSSESILTTIVTDVRAEQS
ncbi:TlpA disulfide reductase family protein [uncultured Microbacterium sp.]|uniref:TlpA family protein disulfide reductase n=1 Tax=uncultured Microbacterium sp. TaxID=191216 RepID=UPI002629CF79|nr:TlpA disulfide reductase family protein [uncultured Microbacterium sp.]